MVVNVRLPGAWRPVGIHHPGSDDIDGRAWERAVDGCVGDAGAVDGHPDLLRRICARDGHDKVGAAVEGGGVHDVEEHLESACWVSFGLSVDMGGEGGKEVC